MKKARIYKHQPLVNAIYEVANVIDGFQRNCKSVKIYLTKRPFYENLSIDMDFKDLPGDSIPEDPDADNRHKVH